MRLSEYKAFSAKMYLDLEVVFKAYGLKVGKLSAAIDEHAGTVRLSVTLNDAMLKDAGGNATTPEAERYKRLAQMFGCKPEWLGRTSRQGYKLLGMKDTRSAKCMLIQRDGRTYVATSIDVAKMFTN